MSDVDYGKLFGLESLPGSVVLAIAYGILLGWYSYQAIRHWTYVFASLAIFCAIRTVAFILRAVIVSLSSASHTLTLITADGALFGVGFFTLLYSAYILVLDRESLLDQPPRRGIIPMLTDNPWMFTVATIISVIVGIIGFAQPSQHEPEDGKGLRKISAILFLVLTVLLAYQTLILTSMELRATVPDRNDEELTGKRYGMYILCFISLVLLIRQAFATATVEKPRKLNNEHFWYPFIVIPEILSVILYATPGLVPSRAELSAREKIQSIMPFTHLRRHMARGVTQ